MSPREFDGADQILEHYDTDGDLTGTTVVKSLWDDYSRGEAEALWELTAELCPCGCGQPMDKAHDASTVAVVEKFTCAYRRAAERVERADRKKHEKDPDRLDGVFWYPRPYDPERDAGRTRQRTMSGPNGDGKPQRRPRTLGR